MFVLEDKKRLIKVSLSKLSVKGIQSHPNKKKLAATKQAAGRGGEPTIKKDTHGSDSFKGGSVVMLQTINISPVIDGFLKELSLKKTKFTSDRINKITNILSKPKNELLRFSFMIFVTVSVGVLKYLLSFC